MEKARCNTELYSNLRGPLNNVKPSNFWGSHHITVTLLSPYVLEELLLLCVSLIEFVNTTCCIDELHLTSVEWM